MKRKQFKKNYEIPALRKAHYTRANPDPNPPPVFDNPNLISRK